MSEFLITSTQLFDYQKLILWCLR